MTLVGRVVKGIELLSSLPRGSEQMGFYSKGAGGAHRSVQRAHRGARAVAVGDGIDEMKRPSRSKAAGALDQ